MSTRFELVTIGGEEYRLRFPVTAVQDAQKKAGKSFGALMAALTVMDLDAYAHLFWAALRGGRENTSFQDAQRLFQEWLDGGATLDEVAETIDRAAIASGFYKAPDEKPAKGDDGPLGPAPEPSETG